MGEGMAKRVRCERCQRPQALCYCAQLSPLDNVWPIWILQHPAEARHALGTARIAALGLRECTLALSEQTDTAHPFATAEPAPALIYPGPTSRPLHELVDTPRRPLLFIDATWRKSRRMLMENPWLEALPRYALSAPPPSRYRIRREPNPEAISTLEAIVHCLGLLEGDATRYHPLLEQMDRLVDEQIAHMGEEVFVRNYRRDKD
jgi:DTW domain-containing protein YfiP